MRCSEAREIIQTRMDGADNVRANAAGEHIASCADCREWQRGMDAVLAAVAQARDDVPEIDVASAVMSRLPERHPASVPVRRSPARALAWLAACWVIGLLLTVSVVARLDVGGLSLISGGVRWLAGVSGTLAAPTAALSVAVKAVAGAAGAIAGVLSDTLARHYALVLLFLIVDCVLLAAAAALWLKRFPVIRRFSVLA